MRNKTWVVEIHGESVELSDAEYGALWDLIDNEDESALRELAAKYLKRERARRAND